MRQNSRIRKKIAQKGIFSRQSSLTAFQKQILFLLIHEGLNQQQIAQSLGRSYITIRIRLGEIKKKLKADTLIQAAARAVEMGLVSTPKIEKR